MLRLATRLLASVLVILLATQVGRRFPSLGGLVAVMPLTGLLVMLWLYADYSGDPAAMVGYCEGAVFGIVPTILFFITAWLCFRRHLPLWAVLSTSFAIWLLGAAVHQWLLRRP